MPDLPTQPQSTSNQKSINWKRILIVVVIAAVVIGAVLGYRLLFNAWNASNENNIQLWKSYQNQEWKVSIKYPGDFKILNETKFQDHNAYKVIFTSPDYSTFVGFISNGGSISIEVIRDLELMSIVRSKFDRNKYKTTINISIDEVEGYRIKNFSWGESRGLGEVVIVENKGVLYKIDFVAENKHVERFTKIFEQVLSSFQFLD